MDESVLTYCQKLSAFGKSRSVNDINYLTNQLTLQMIVRTVFGDQSFSMFGVNGNHVLFDALQSICGLLVLFYSFKSIIVVNGFMYKMNNVAIGFLIRVPVIGKSLGKLLAPDIKD